MSLTSIDMKVAALIDHDRKEWKLDHISELFHPLDYGLILAIPLGCQGTEDRLIWHLDTRGRFTVKSAHHLALKISESGAPSSSGGLHSDLNFLWQRKVPNKVKIFGWKVCHNALPALHNLATRRVDVSDCCPLCSQTGELLEHTLVTCPFARQIWALSCLPWRIISTTFDIPENWMRGVCSALTSEESDRFLMLCWSIWKSRNKRLMEGKSQQSLDAVLLADRSLHEFKEFSACLAPSPSPQRTEQCWLPPPSESVKINFDGAVFSSQTTMGAGIVVRNSEGVCLAWRTRRFLYASDADLAEVLAASEAASLAIQKGWQSIILEGDCKNIIARLNSNDVDLSVLGPIVDDTRNLMRSFSCCKAEFVPRECNSCP
ncbi:UNVERIFIED_CONTAM: hypothetical protein Slati_4233500 [Sesamum latifolium]|uniref:Reverse transcriptase zinc-binding domain-containing protein n=1 Tax=Sesamum latifolium TaxID=2727402 RepID=A0AAW2TAV7_9LAMI